MLVWMPSGKPQLPVISDGAYPATVDVVYSISTELLLSRLPMMRHFAFAGELQHLLFLLSFFLRKTMLHGNSLFHATSDCFRRDLPWLLLHNWLSESYIHSRWPHSWTSCFVFSETSKKSKSIRTLAAAKLFEIASIELFNRASVTTRVYDRNRSQN